MGGGEYKTPPSFIFGGITKLSWLKVYLVLVKKSPTKLFSRENTGFGYINTICVLKMFGFFPSETETLTGEQPSSLDPTPDKRFVTKMSTASPIVVMSPEPAPPCCHRAENEPWMMTWAGDFRNGTFWPRLFPPLIPCLAHPWLYKLLLI